jgi:hypothetical protein
LSELTTPTTTTPTSSTLNRWAITGGIGRVDVLDARQYRDHLQTGVHVDWTI